MSIGSDNLTSAPGNWGREMDSFVRLPNVDSSQVRTRVPRHFPFRPADMSGGSQDPPPWLFEERMRTGPYGLTSFWVQPNFPLRFNHERANPRFRQFVPQYPPRNMDQWRMQLPSHEEESRLNQEEQKKAIKMLKKQVYKYYPKRWCLYYRKSASTSFNENDEDGEGCAICLEDFVPYQEVLVTPCNHMFHEDCIVPWVKSNGQCPVCRFAFCERLR